MSVADEFADLARYNAEVARGIVHTEAWKGRMAHEQKRFDWAAKRELLMQHGGRLEELGPPPPPVYIHPRDKIGTETGRSVAAHSIVLACVAAGMGALAALLLVFLA